MLSMKVAERVNSEFSSQRKQHFFLLLFFSYMRLWMFTKLIMGKTFYAVHKTNNYAVHFIQCVCGCMCAQLLSTVRIFDAPWTVTCQAPLSVEFPRQEYWSGLPFPTWGGLPVLGIESMFPKSPALAGRFFTTVPPGKHISKTGRKINK